MYETAIESEKLTKLNACMDTQTELRNELEKIETEWVEERIEKRVREGGVNLTTSGKQTKEECNYDLVTEKDEIIMDPEESKRYIAKYYENLCQVIEGCPEVERKCKHLP